MIYFLLFHRTGFIKIGTSENPATRFLELRAQVGTFDVLGVMDGDREAEQCLHEQFREWRSEDVGYYTPHEYYLDNEPLRDYIRGNTHMDYGRYGVVKPGKSQAWILPFSMSREARLSHLRKLMHDYPGSRIHGVLTTTAILDYALEQLEIELSQKHPDRTE